MSVIRLDKLLARRRRLTVRGRQTRGFRSSRRLNMESLECRDLLTAGVELPAADLLGDDSAPLLREVVVEESAGWIARTAVMEDGWAEALGEKESPVEATFQLTTLSWNADPEIKALDEPVWFTAWRGDAADLEYGDAEAGEVFATAVLLDDSADAEFRITMIADPLEATGEIVDSGDGEVRITMITDPLDSDADPVDGEVRITSVDEELVTTTSAGSPLHNPDNPHDVNGDGLVGPLDVLIVVNYINGDQGGAQLMSAMAVGATYFVDVDADGQVGALDVLRLTNVLNGSGGEESAVTAPAAASLWYDGSQADPAPQIAAGQESGEDDLLADAGRRMRDPGAADYEKVLAEDDEIWNRYQEEAAFSDDADWLLPELL